MPSAGRLSEASIASENNFPNVPKSDMAIARMPANGPRPTTLMKISAQISTSTPRIASRKRRTAKCVKMFGTTFLAASSPTGSARIAAASVPRSAIASVSARAWRKSGSLTAGARRKHHRDDVGDLRRAGAEAVERKLQPPEAVERKRGQRCDHDGDQRPPADTRAEQRGVPRPQLVALCQHDLVQGPPHLRCSRPRSACRSRSVIRSMMTTVAMMSSRIAETSE